MKKKLSLVSLNKNEVKKNNLKELHKEELGTLKGGIKCSFQQCGCWCWNINNTIAVDDEVKLHSTNLYDYLPL